MNDILPSVCPNAVYQDIGYCDHIRHSTSDGSHTPYHA